MNIEKRALRFAIKAHKGQVRKSDPDKPMIIHPINVANILREYGFDSLVIAAGYLHDVVEDTKYGEKYIQKIFGDDITSLVMTASEPDKTLDWEERKKHTIEVIKKADLRHKAVVCADKISNLEDLRIIFESNQKVDFRAFNRGFDSQKWYYESIYKSLIENEDENYPMFVRLKEIIDYIFENKKNDNYVKNIIFNDKSDEYNKLLQLHYKKQEIKKMVGIIDNTIPYVIEFTGTPRTGKTTLINNLYDFFKKAGFVVEILEEFTTSKKYKKEIWPTLKDKYKSVVNTEIPKHVLRQLEDALKKKPEIIIVDRSLFDRTIWIDRLYLKGGITEEEYKNYFDIYTPLIKEKINIVISTYTDSITSLKRDYEANLSLEKRNFLNEDNINEYNTSLINMEKYANSCGINFYKFDTTGRSQREISIDVANTILSDMKKFYIEQMNKFFK